ncbi:MAG: nitrite reductase large subunit, partial [Pseudomonadota bacterium]
TEEEAVDYITAFMQLYRENAKYLDRPYKWVAKVGLDWVKETLADDETRAALIARFDHSQSIYQTDPWAERAAANPARKFAPLADLTLEAAE